MNVDGVTPGPGATVGALGVMGPEDGVAVGVAAAGSGEAVGVGVGSEVGVARVHASSNSSSRAIAPRGRPFMASLDADQGDQRGRKQLPVPLMRVAKGYPLPGPGGTALGRVLMADCQRRHV